MSRYRVLQVRKPTPWTALVLDEETQDGWQMYSWGGWMRRSTGWISENGEFVESASATGLVAELQGRGMEMIREDFELEVTNE